MVGHEAEEGRHQAGAHIGAGHLDADEGLGPVRPEELRGGVDGAGVDGGAAQTRQDEPREGRRRPQGQQQGQDAHSDHRQTQPDHAPVAQAHGQKPAEGPAPGDAQVKQAGAARRRLLIQAPGQDQVAAGPLSRGGLQGAVAEEQQHHLPGSGGRDGPAQGEGLFLSALRRPGPALPQTQTQHQDHCQTDLQEADVPVAHVPPLAAGQGKGHGVGAQGGPDAPHAVEPAHVAAGVVEGHIVVQRRVHAARPQAVGHRPQAQGQEGAADGEAEEGGGGDAHAEGGDPAGAQPPGQPVAAKAGDDGAGGDDHGDDPHVGHRDPQLPVYGGPGGAQQGVRQTQADEGQVDDGEQKMDHSAFPPWPQWGGGFFAVPAGRNAAGFASGTSAALL